MTFPTAISYGYGGVVDTGPDTYVNASNVTSFQSESFGKFAAYEIRNTGEVYKNNTPVYVEDWISDVSRVGNYEIRATLASGTSPTSGSLNVWENLSTSRKWEMSIISSCTLTMQIRNKNTLTVVDTFSVTLETYSSEL